MEKSTLKESSCGRNPNKALSNNQFDFHPIASLLPVWLELRSRRHVIALLASTLILRSSGGSIWELSGLRVSGTLNFYHSVTSARGLEKLSV